MLSSTAELSAGSWSLATIPGRWVPGLSCSKLSVASYIPYVKISPISPSFKMTYNRTQYIFSLTAKAVFLHTSKTQLKFRLFTKPFPIDLFISASPVHTHGLYVCMTLCFAPWSHPCTRLNLLHTLCSSHNNCFQMVRFKVWEHVFLSFSFKCQYGRILFRYFPIKIIRGST